MRMRADDDVTLLSTESCSFDFRISLPSLRVHLERHADVWETISGAFSLKCSYIVCKDITVST